MKCNLAQAKQWVSALDQRRFERALQGSRRCVPTHFSGCSFTFAPKPSSTSRLCYSPLAFASFLASDYQKKVAHQRARYSLCRSHKPSTLKSAVSFHKVLPPILGVC